MVSSCSSWKLNSWRTYIEIEIHWNIHWIIMNHYESLNVISVHLFVSHTIQYFLTVLRGLYRIAFRFESESAGQGDLKKTVATVSSQLGGMRICWSFPKRSDWCPIWLGTTGKNPNSCSPESSLGTSFHWLEAFHILDLAASNGCRLRFYGGFLDVFGAQHSQLHDAPWVTVQ